MSLPPIRRPIARQPSLPIFGTTAHSSHVSDHLRIRSNSTATPLRTELQMQSPMPHTTAPATPVVPTATLSSHLERQRLNALVIASGLADEEELQVEGLGLHSSSSQVYLGDPESQELPAPAERRPSHDSDAITTTYQSQTVSSPRTSTSLEDLDEFDEDASYYGKEINTLFSPYSRPPSVSGPADAEIAEPAASKWSLSSSIQMDLEKSRRSSPTKSIKNRTDKIKSFISRFTPNSPPPTPDKHFSMVSRSSYEKQLRRERTHSDVLVAFTSRGSVSSQIHGVAHGSWDSVPPTPTTAVSSTTMSVSTGYSPVTPSDNESDPRDAFRVSEEKLAGGIGLSRVDSGVFARDTSSSISGTNTSVPNSPVDAVPPQFPLKHAVSTTSLRINGLKGLASRIGLAPSENLYEESVNEKASAQLSQAHPPRSFKERMMLKNNGSALSLILGMGNKSSKSKRKLLISGVEKGDHLKYEAISNWCEVSSFCASSVLI
ncbi:hypothetical protein M378DRAFT_336284 [Amanita muscaria Koide BX008]|uniref:Uncharacterized protein n=1 Tax=Amanita muscaria (strain Koide BX008) TaxID=946122 RepID=A0A0C2SVW7_AMAMK|nr:hypothetical protein M378DRAFT_336284 [Amanita muscaria Koide BX008]